MLKAEDTIVLNGNPGPLLSFNDEVTLNQFIERPEYGSGIEIYDKFNNTL